MDEDVRIWVHDKYAEIQTWLGERPGGYRVDPFYIRSGIGSKAYCWDDYARKWRLLHTGDVLFKREDGTVGHEPARQKNEVV